MTSTKMTYTDGRLRIAHTDPWGEFKGMDINPLELDLISIDAMKRCAEDLV